MTPSNRTGLRNGWAAASKAVTASMSAASGNAPGTVRLRVMIWKSAKRLSRSRFLPRCRCSHNSAKPWPPRAPVHAWLPRDLRRLSQTYPRRRSAATERRLNIASAEIPIRFLFFTAPADLECLSGSDAYRGCGRAKVLLRAGRSWRRRLPACPVPATESGSMMDVLLIGAALAFFAACFAYTRACDRL